MWNKSVGLISEVIKMLLTVLFPQLASFLGQSTNYILTDDKSQVPYKFFIWGVHENVNKWTSGHSKLFKFIVAYQGHRIVILYYNCSGKI
jgi:hypothetical protein